MIVQYILLLIIALIVFFIIIRFRSRELSLLPFLFWIVLWIGAGIVVWNPEIPQRIANELGIGRGVDLIVYFAILFIVFAQFKMLVRQERMEKEITKVVREIALQPKSQITNYKYQTNPNDPNTKY